MTSLLPRFQFDQGNLGELCADRELRTAEVHKPNDFYGQASVLKWYARIPRCYALKAVLEHGLALRDQVWEVDAAAPLPMNFAASDIRATLLRAKTGKCTVPIGFGFLYAMRLARRGRGSVPQRQGTVVFPCHSSHLVDCEFDHDDYADRLTRLPDSMRPVVVCAYWKDYLAGRYAPYARRGLPLVTAGHIYDCQFMPRLYDVCRHFEYAVSNQIGSHLFLSVASGCKFHYLDSRELRYQLSAEERARLDEGKARLLQLKRQSRQLFGTIEGARVVGCASAPRERNRFVSDVVGDRHVQSPRGLRSLLLRAELLDKFASAPDGTPYLGWRSSPFLTRQAARTGRLCRSVAKRLPTVNRRAA